MYNNWYGQHQQPAAGTSQGAAAPPAWVAQAGFQTDRTGRFIVATRVSTETLNKLHKMFLFPSKNNIQ